MGCLNSKGEFDHWFGNIHLSGPCNRSCYFCIGQHMMALDSENTLNEWPLPGLGRFLGECKARNVKEINVTGTNTDPSLFKHTHKLIREIRAKIPDVVIGVRTNGVKLGSWMDPYDKGSFSFTSIDPKVYRKTMGGKPPEPKDLWEAVAGRPWKINIVLTPESVTTLYETIGALSDVGFRTFNLREPYGQAHVGNPLAHLTPVCMTLGMPTYQFGESRVTYWDVHYVHVESVNLYATGRVSTDYPITRGHDDEGEVKDQSHFPSGRHRKQWVNLTLNQSD